MDDLHRRGKIKPAQVKNITVKIFLTSLTFILLTACSSQAVYDMIHERERQQCLQQGNTDCPKAESYNKYKQKRDELVKPDNPEKQNP